MERMIDNPMTFGDYPGAEEPEMTVVCPKCGRAWEGFESRRDDGELEWECEDFNYDWDFPIQNGMCPICAWEKHTVNDEFDYIESRGEESLVLNWFLFYRQTEKETISIDKARILWDGFKRNDPDGWKDVVHDYIVDREYSDFIDWMMGK